MRMKTNQNENNLLQKHFYQMNIKLIIKNIKLIIKLFVSWSVNMSGTGTSQKLVARMFTVHQVIQHKGLKCK